MKYIKREISSALYNQLKDIKSYIERAQYFDILIEWYCGYGYYGCDVKEENGKYYVYHTIGESCD